MAGRAEGEESGKVRAKGLGEEIESHGVAAESGEKEATQERTERRGKRSGRKESKREASDALEVEVEEAARIGDLRGMMGDLACGG